MSDLRDSFILHFLHHDSQYPLKSSRHCWKFRLSTLRARNSACPLSIHYVWARNSSQYTLHYKKGICVLPVMARNPARLFNTSSKLMAIKEFCPLITYPHSVYLCPLIIYLYYWQVILPVDFVYTITGILHAEYNLSYRQRNSAKDVQLTAFEVAVTKNTACN